MMITAMQIESLRVLADAAMTRPSQKTTRALIVRWEELSGTIPDSARKRALVSAVKDLRGDSWISQMGWRSKYVYELLGHLSIWLEGWEARV